MPVKASQVLREWGRAGLKCPPDCLPPDLRSNTGRDSLTEVAVRKCAIACDRDNQVQCQLAHDNGICVLPLQNKSKTVSLCLRHVGRIRDNVRSACALRGVCVEVEVDPHPLLRAEVFCKVIKSKIHSPRRSLLRCLPLHHLHHRLDALRDDTPIVYCDKAPMLREVPEGDDAEEELLRLHLALQQELFGNGLAFRQRHVVREELPLVASEDAKFHLQVLQPPLGSPASAIHLGDFHPDLVRQAQLRVEGDVLLDGNSSKAALRYEML
mmetsp:Transcript_112340/g.350068  ORF Transcript_112340/g.350068 Transcript_112340/m.350068 type:complete len:268 (+) Transcript_112340:105-908(+)